MLALLICRHNVPTRTRLQRIPFLPVYTYTRIPARVAAPAVAIRHRHQFQYYND